LPAPATLADVRDATVLVRLDLNVPLDGRAIADDARLHAALPTLRALAAGRNRVRVVAHLGRPLGVQPELTLRPLADALSRLLDEPVPLATERRAPTGASIALLENVRFDPRETSRSADERRALAAELRADSGADVVVADAFACLHRRHASIVELVQAGPSLAGPLVAGELRALAALQEAGDAPLVLVGGRRAREKLSLLAALASTPATIALGAEMAAGLLALAAEERPHGPVARALLQRPETLLPEDVVARDERGRLRTLPLSDVHPAVRVLDLGPRARAHYAELVHAARAVVWNGPPGMQHDPNARAGAEALARACATTRAVTLVGGGTTSMPLRWLGLAERVTHVSTGGTVLLELLAQRPLPGLAALRSSPTATTSSTAASTRPRPARAGTAPA